MSKKPIAKATINRELATLKAFFNMAIRDGKTDVNPVKEEIFSKRIIRKKGF